MAKKKVKKTKEPETRSGTKKVSNAQVLIHLGVQIAELHKRIDRIVLALSTAKTVKGL